MNDNDHYEGVIAFYNQQGNYGFINVEEFTNDVFFHEEALDLNFDPVEGAEVTVTVEHADKGPRATSMSQTEDDDSETAEDDSAYQFIDSSETEEEETTEADDGADDAPFRVRKWSLGNHSVTTDVEADDLLEEAQNAEGVDDELANILAEAAEMVESTRVKDFECPVCGLNHGHSDSKHDIRSAFGVEKAFADEMEMNPYCHCGVNELAMLVDFFHFINEPVFHDQHEFEGVLELRHDDVQSIIDATNEVTYEDAREAGMDVSGRDGAYLDLEDAIEWVRREKGVRTLVPDDIMPDLRRFFNRVNHIKDAANRAPIPQEAQTDISEARESIVSVIEG